MVEARSKPFKKGACDFMAKGGACLNIFGGGVVFMDAADAAHRGIELGGKRFSHRASNEFIFVSETIEH